MTLTGYTVSNQTSSIYRFDIPSRPVSTCPNVKKLPNPIRPPVPPQSNFTGLINIGGNLLAISDNGGFYQGLNRSSSIFKQTGSQLNGLAFGNSSNNLYSFRTEYDARGNVDGSQLVRLNRISGGISKLGSKNNLFVEDLTLIESGKGFAIIGPDSTSLAEININTGQLSNLTTLTPRLQESASLDHDPNSNMLYLFSNSGKLFSVNPKSGLIQRLCDTQLPKRVSERNSTFNSFAIQSHEPIGAITTTPVSYGMANLSILTLIELILSCHFLVIIVLRYQTIKF